MLILKIILILNMFIIPEAEWKRVDTDQQISFLFPNTPQTQKTLTGEFPSTVYQTKDLTCVLGVVCSDFSSKKEALSKENVPLLYEELKKGSVGMETAVLKKEVTIPYDQMLIKEIEYSVMKENHEMTYFKRFIFRDKYVYQISIGGRTRHLPQIEMERERFFNSIHFTE